jgi:hypothetical protein
MPALDAMPEESCQGVYVSVVLISAVCSDELIFSRSNRFTPEKERKFSKFRDDASLNGILRDEKIGSTPSVKKQINFFSTSSRLITRNFHTL